MKSKFYRLAAFLLSLVICCSMGVSAFAGSSSIEYILTSSVNIDNLQIGDEVTISFAISSSAKYKIDVFQNEIKYDTNRYTLVDGSVSTDYGSSTRVRGTDGYVFLNYTGRNYKDLDAGVPLHIGSFKLKVTGDNGSRGIYSTNTEIRVEDGTIFNAVCTDVVPNATVPHTHSWSDKWNNDSSNHWHECTVNDCPIKENNQKNGFAAHSAGDWIVDKAATATEGGLRHKECTVCGYTMISESTPATGVPGYSLAFVTNGGTSVSAITAKEGTTVDLTKYVTTRSGYTFTGWYTDAALKNKVTSVKISGNTTVYAGWKQNDTPVDPVKTYSLIFVTNGGTSISAVTAESGRVIDLTRYTTVRRGYSFTGWYTDVSLRNKVTAMKLTEDTVVYAGWEKDEIDIPIIPVVPVTPDIPDNLNGAEHFAYIVGYDDGKVHPEADITRAEVATIFFRLLNDDVREQYLTRTNSFRDVSSDAWYNTAVSTMANMGVLKGYEGYFRPNDPITRAEFAAIAARFADETGTEYIEFKDISGHWAEPEILKAASLGWVEGYNGSYRPNDSITRAEAMTIINRVLCRIPETADDLLPGMRVWTDNADTSKWYYLAVQEATNSHTFEYKDDTYESWTALTSDPDWSKYQ